MPSSSETCSAAPSSFALRSGISPSSSPGLIQRIFRFLRPSHRHGASSAALLMMAAIMLSRVFGFLREAYIASAFGAGWKTDAFVAAFTLPDYLNYLVAGGALSITFVSMFGRYIAQNRDADAQQAFNIVITVMTVVLTCGVVVAELFTSPIEHLMFPKFSPEKLELCVSLTRILLPAQLFFYVGGVLSAVMQSRRQFMVPALGPLLYNIFIILGGVFLGRYLGIASLAVGALAGSFLGPFFINAIGTHQAGMKYRISFNVSHPGFREWLRLSIPLMLGLSLITVDDWIARYYASGGVGDIARLNYAKRLFQVPIAVLGQAVGQASLPFFTRLFAEKKFADFAATVNNAIYRLAALSLLASAWMLGAAFPLVDVLYRRGYFTPSDAHTTAVFFYWYALSLVFWSAQGLYARAFYAAGDMLTPMVASTIITLASIPAYYFLFHKMEVVGLVIASDLGIAANTITLAILADRKKLVPLNGLPWAELGKVLAATFFAGYLALVVAPPTGIEAKEFTSLALITLMWAAGAAAGLVVMRSNLLAMLPGYKNR